MCLLLLRARPRRHLAALSRHCALRSRRRHLRRRALGDDEGDAAGRAARPTRTAPSSRFAKGCGSSRRSRARGSTPRSADRVRRARRRRDLPRLGRDARRAAVRGAAAARRRSSTSCARSPRASRTSRARRVLRQLTIGVGAALLVAGFSETLIFAVDSEPRTASPSFIGVHGRVPGRRRDPRRPHGGAAACGGSASCGSRASASSLFGVGDVLLARAAARRRRCAPTAVAGLGHRLGGRRARDRLPAAQPEPAARQGVRGCEHAVQRAADDLHRTQAQHSSR